MIHFTKSTISRDFVKLSITNDPHAVNQLDLEKDCSSFELPGIYNQSSIKTRFVKGKLFFQKAFKNVAWGKKRLCYL